MYEYKNKKDKAEESTIRPNAKTKDNYFKFVSYTKRRVLVHL